MNFSHWLRASLRAALIGMGAVSVSLPFLFALHRHFELGAPPIKGVVTLGLGVIGACLGASLLGRVLVTLLERRASGALAALCGFVWGAVLAITLATSYGGMIAEDAAKHAAILAFQNRDRIAKTARESVEQARAGHASKAATDAGFVFSDEAKEVAIRGAAQIPALSLLMWALLIPPFLSALECRGARRFV